MSRSRMSSTLVPNTVCADVNALASIRSHRWRPGLARQGRFSRHSEVFTSSREASGAGLALSLALDELRSQAMGESAELEDRRAILWVQDRAAARLSGRPYRPGLPRAVRPRLIHVLADKPQDLLFALEEGLRCREIACVIGELAGNPRALDFTASRRLSLAAEKHSSALWLVRLDAGRELSSARLRWEVTSASSGAPEWNSQAPGTPSWKAELFRARSHPPGQWILHDDGTGLVASRPHGSGEGRAAAANPFHLVRASRDRPLATC